MSSLKRVHDIDRQIKKLEEEKEYITKQFSGLTDEQYFATVIHDLLCTSNHTDGCSWEYEKWDNVEQTHAKKRYLEKARHATNAGYDAVDFIKFVETFLSL